MPTQRSLISASALPLRFSFPSTYLSPSCTFQSGRQFHASPAHGKKETNKKRGVSALRRTGLRKGMTLSVKLENLPRPVLDPERRSKLEVDPNHGLWAFFRSRETSIAEPEIVSKYGRAWTVEELRRKSWRDLHYLWWLCVKERNLISTEETERRRLKAGYGELESQQRDAEVKTTMRAIKHTLTERWYSWENARELRENPPKLESQSWTTPWTEEVVEKERGLRRTAGAEVEVSTAEEASRSDLLEPV